MNQDFDIYFITDISYEALAVASLHGNKIPKEWENLVMSLDSTKKRVLIQSSDPWDFESKKCNLLGSLLEDESKKYIPYLVKEWNNLYEGMVISINEKIQDLNQRIQIAIRIRQNFQKEDKDSPQK